MAEQFKVYRETALPGSLEPYSVYFIAPSGAGNSDFLELYVTNAAGTSTRRVVNRSDVLSMIQAEMASAGVNNLIIVADITERDGLSLASPAFAYVKDATDDVSVDAGGATYLWDNDKEEWIKVSEAESLDIELKWSEIDGRPSSSVANIDDAVTKRHTHANKTQLDKVGEDNNGNFTYGGSIPHIAWDTIGW